MTEMRSASATRNAGLEDLIHILRGEHARKVDVVAPAAAIRACGGRLVVAGTEPVLDADGVTLADGTYLPTAVADEGLSAKLGVPLAYLRRLRDEHVDLYDDNVNGWLSHPANAGRKFLVRALRDDGGSGDGVARAFLSDRYKTVDNLDALMAALDGVRQAGAPVRIDGCDLTDRRMYVRVRSDSVSALAPTLLRDYRSPFSGARGADNPVVWAGFEIANSETGCGAFTIAPRLVVEICANGMTITQDALRAVHLGGRLDEGVKPWWFDANTEPERWQVCADVHDEGDTQVLSHVGDIDIVLVDIGGSADPFGVLDGEDADLGLIAEALLDPATSRLTPELDELIEPAGSRLLILDSARLTPDWRGFGLGVLLAGTAIKKLSGGVRLAACYPAPLGEPGDADGEDDPVGRGVATATLSEVWGQLGFDHFRGGVHVLDLNLVTLDESLERLRKQAKRQRTCG